jgi:peptide/nickel transport system permease protein
VSTVGTDLQVVQVLADEELDARAERGYWSESVRRLARDRVALASAALLVIFAVVALLAPLISRFVTHYQPETQDLLATFQGPSGAHWLGTDELGRDTLSRLVWGTRVSLGVGVLAVFVQLLLGTLVGLTTGFYGGWVDMVSMRVVDSVLAFPDVFLFMLVVVLIRPTPVALAFILASVGWADVSRLIRGDVMVLKHEDYVLALRSLGATSRRIIFGHILRNALPIVIVTASLRIGQVILIEAALDYLGLGIQPPTASWGNMLGNAQEYFYHSYWLVILPGIAIFSTVLATNLLGNALRDALDPRLRHALIQV